MNLLIIQTLLQISKFKLQVMSLKEAVEEQLDLILKLEQERKLMKKQNRVLKERINQLTKISQKYMDVSCNKQMIQIACGTESLAEIENQQDINYNPLTTFKLYKAQSETENKPKDYCDASCQSQFDFKQNIQLNMTNANMSRLYEAQQLLKMLDTTQNKQSSKKIPIAKIPTQSMTKTQILKHQQNQLKSVNNPSNKVNQEGLANQILSMSKQINTLKKELQSSQHNRKLKEKQLKQLKKCIETKNQSIEKLNKQFNELSNILNTDKYKSIKNLQKQLKQTKNNQMDSNRNMEKLRQMLKGITEQYEQYRTNIENQMKKNEYDTRKVIQQNKLLKQQNEKYKKLLIEYERTEKYLAVSLKERILQQ